MGREQQTSRRPLGVVVRVLGVVTLIGPAGEPVPLTTAERRLLAVLTASGDDGASTLQLERAVWDDAPPRTARPSLHNHLHRLRRKLDANRLVLDGDRYRLVPHVRTDAHVFESWLLEAEEAMRDGAPEDAVHLLRDARAWWRGEPYAGLSAAPGVLAAQTHLLGRRVVADDLLVQALLESGKGAAAVGELEELLTDDPAHEARWELLVETLQQSGRRGEGLDAFRRAREHLVAAFGVEPGHRLQALQQLLLHGAPLTAPLSLESAPVGREQVISNVLTALDDVGAAVVHGEGGIGKTAVLREVAARWSGDVVLVACGGSPFAALAPVAALMEQLAPRLIDQGLPPSLTQLVTVLHGGSPVGTGSPGTLVRRASEVITAALAADPTTLLVLDDADQGGPTTRSILGHIVRGLSSPVLLAVREREGVLPVRADSAEFSLTGLDTRAATELAALVLQTRVGDAFGAWLQSYTGGHPLFMLALLSDLIARGLVSVHGRDPRPPSVAPVPVHIRELLEQRIARLGSLPRRAVDVVAVMGQPVHPSLVADLVRPEDLQPALDGGILVTSDGGELRFPHELLRQVAYDAVPSGRRSELHHMLSGLDASAAHQATHLLAAYDLDPHAALDAMVEAGTESLAGHAYAEAADWFDRALTAGRQRMDAQTVLTLRVEVADARRLAGIEGHAEELLAAAEESGRTGGLDLRRRATLAALRLGGGVEAGDAQRRAAALAEQVLADETDPTWWARIAAAASLVHSISGTPATCHDLFTAAWSAAGDRDEVLLDVLPYAYMALAHPDDLDERTRAATRLARAAQRTQDPVAQFEAGHLAFSAALMRADGPAARRAHRDMLALTDRVADAGRRWSLAYQEAALAAVDGRLEQAEALAGLALEIGSGVAAKRAFGAYAGQVFELRRQQGRLPELAELILQLVNDQPEIPGWAAVGSLALVTVDPERSRVLFDSAAAHGMSLIPRDFAWLGAVMSLGRTAVAFADADRAQLVESVLLPYADLVCWQGTCSWGPVAEVLAGLADVQGLHARRAHFDQLAASRHAGLVRADSGEDSRLPSR